jgi:hypothetical protein
VVLEFELRALCLLGSHVSSPLCLSNFSRGFSHFCTGLTTILLPQPPV